MNALEIKLNKLNSDLYTKLTKTIGEVSSLLTKYDSNFPKYTDHSISHTGQVFKLASQLLTAEEIDNLNEDEIYVLSMACYLHDIGMCIPEDKIESIGGTEAFIHYKETTPNISTEDYIRDIHHELSNKFILEEWELLNIPNIQYAKAIGLVARGHRKVDLSNLDEYPTKFFVKDGRDFVCLPFITAILRIADELDITNARTPALLSKYYLPNNERSKKEWLKHIVTTQINFTEDFVSYQVKCSDHNMLAALETQFDKIQKTIHHCQRVIRTIGNTEKRRFNLNLMRVLPRFEFIDFDPKGIKFSFDVQNVTKTFIGEDLYEDSLAAIREAVQNSIDSCLYRKKLHTDTYEPKIILTLNNDKLIISDNGLGMDEFIIENFFGRLGSSFYEQADIKSKFDAIGQFGVGVFSYFLISDFIEIQTKTEHGQNLRFRINNDPKNYFHFYDKTDQIDQGTIVTFNLKRSVLDQLKFHTIEKYLKKYFRHIEFTIEFNEANSSNQLLLKSSPIEIDTEKEIKNRIGLEYRNQAENLEIITTTINNEQLIGECGLIIRKIDKHFTFDNALYLLDSSSFESRYRRISLSEVAFSQKGVFINNYGGNLLSGIVGKINLIQKERLNINRQDFTNQERITKIIGQFETQIIEKVFFKLSQLFEAKILSKLTQEFMNHYFNPSPYAKETDLVTVLQERAYFEVFSENKTKYISLKQLLLDYPEFLLIGSFEKKRAIAKHFGLPLVLCQVKSSNTSIFDTFKRLIVYFYEYQPSIVKSEGLAYQKLSKNIDIQHKNEIDEFRKLTEYYYHTFEPTDGQGLMSSVWLRKKNVKMVDEDHYIFNSNNSFVRKMIQSKLLIKENKDISRICNSCINVINEYHTWGYKNSTIPSTIEKLNDIIQPLNKIEKFYIFSELDFSTE